VLPAVPRLSEWYREVVLREVSRVARHVVTAAETVGPAS
jgi:hypothetical protein